MCLATQCGQLFQVGLMHGLHITAAGFGAKRHAAIKPCGNRGLAPGIQISAEPRGDFQGNFYFRALQAFVQLICTADRRVFFEIPRATECLKIGTALRALILVVDGEGEVFHVQRNAVAKNHHHEQRAQQGKGHAHLVAQQLFGFATGHGNQPGQAETPFADRWRRIDRRRGDRLGRRGRAGVLVVLGLFQAGDKRRFQRIAVELVL